MSFLVCLQSQYEQRCSQLIGLSLCMKNLTGEFPKFLRMRGTGFAICGLGRTYIMVRGTGGREEGEKGKGGFGGKKWTPEIMEICKQFLFNLMVPTL